MSLFTAAVPRQYAPAAYTPTQSELRSGTWHVGLHYEGHFPQTEMTCGCVKAKCGLAAPTAEIGCYHHHGARPILRAHLATACR